GYDSIASNFVDSKSPWRKYGSPIAGGVGMLAPELAKTAVAQRVGAAAMNSRLATGLLSRFAGARAIGAVASRATVGLALVWGMNKIFQAAIGSDYEASVNKRVTDLIYDEHVYKLDKWDFLALPLALKGVRASCRFIAPDAMEWGVMKDNQDLRDDIYKQDEKDSEKGEDMMREVLPTFLHATNEADREQMLKLLGSPVEFDAAENFLVLAIMGSQAGSDPKDPASIVKTLKPNMSDDEVETFLRKFLAYQTQQVAKGLVFVDRPLNRWAREIFTEDGILRTGDTARTKLIDRWPPPPIPVASPQ
ncbi:MAG TPA: hypothetical protein VFW62_11055, partial [bacterium]|nr:hypothetical protein [bacterium]